jgi:hypothetical protein
MKPLEAPDASPTLDGIDDLGSGGASPDLGGLSEPAAPGEVSDELGGTDPLEGGVDEALGGEPSEKFTAGVEKAFQDAFGKPMDEGIKQVLQGIATMQGGSTPATDDLDATGGEIPGGDKDPLAGDGMEVDPASDPAAQGSGVGAAPGGAADAGAPTPGGSDLLAKSRGRLTKVASTSDWVAKLAAKLAK